MHATNITNASRRTRTVCTKESGAASHVKAGTAAFESANQLRKRECGQLGAQVPAPVKKESKRKRARARERERERLFPGLGTLEAPS